MKYIAWLLLLIPLLLAAGACGGSGNDTSGGTITIIPDLDQRREGLNEQDTLDLFVSIMERRAEYSDGSATVTLNDDNTLTVDYSGIDDDIALDLFQKKGDLAIRGPKLKGDDMVICLTAPEQEVYVTFDQIQYEQSESGLGLIPVCVLEGDLAANISWRDVETPGLGLISNLDIATVGLQTESGPTLIVGFNGDGNLKLSSVSSDLIGLPMGIFVDGQLVAGPKVSAIIENGQIAIAGLSLRDARILRAQLRAGAIPAPYTVRTND